MIARLQGQVHLRPWHARVTTACSQGAHELSAIKPGDSRAIALTVTLACSCTGSIRRTEAVGAAAVLNRMLGAKRLVGKSPAASLRERDEAAARVKPRA